LLVAVRLDEGLPRAEELRGVGLHVEPAPPWVFLAYSPLQRLRRKTQT
jgi:hypothetical protein